MPADDKGGGQKPPPSDKEQKTQRILNRAASAKAPEYPPTHTGGNIPVYLAGRFAQERERLGPDFTETERQWRIKWHKDQYLHHNEPVKEAIEKLNNDLRNPIRRLYRIPLDWVEKNVLTPAMGPSKAWVTRRFITFLGVFYAASLVAWYEIKYNSQNWEKQAGIRIYAARPEILPGDSRYPISNPRPQPEDYYDMGFRARKAFRDVTKGSFALSKGYNIYDKEY